MNERQRKFCLFVFQGMPANRAYLEAGYTCSAHAAEVGGSRLMRNAEVSACIDEMRGKLYVERTEAQPSTKVLLSRQWVIDQLIENVNRAMQVVPVRNADGEETGVYTWNGSVANKALELLGTEIGMFIEKREIDQTVKIITDRPLTSEQWAERYARAPALKLIKPVDRQ